MNTIEAIKNRRSVRRFKDEAPDRKVMEKIIDATRFAPSWSNFQVARWTLIDDKEVVQKLKDLVKGFTYNIKTLEKAPAVAIVSYVQGKSGKLDQYGIAPDAEDGNVSKWEIFDAGIATQTFCLAAYEKGVSTCIFGVLEEEAVGKLINIPEGEKVASIIVYGYAEKYPDAPPRKEVSEIMRWI